jgi:hypothetical protein
MYSLVYISRAEIPFSDEQLLQLLERSRRKNVITGITGMLLYKNGNFMQLLEGEEKNVRALYADILVDPRHCNINLLIEGPVKARQFPAWTMSFRDLQAVNPDECPGYSAFLNTPLTKEEFAGNPTRAQQLLLLFKELD